MPEAEGVIKYQLDYEKGPAVDPSLIAEINAWRRILFLLQLIGQDASRYGGYGYGNVSCREKPGSEAFIISGTQTAHLPELHANHYVRVTECDATKNRIVASGPVKPSSEALTHGAIYHTAKSVNVVLHIHCPQIWTQAAALQIASTASHISYGTPAMAEEMALLLQGEDINQKGIFSMGGHQDGVITFGASAEQAGTILVNYFSRALQLETTRST